ncbi:MAG: T9SS type A sorting domain-containing protein [Bacteroidetes bacterium]|nr:T9SS type A sorting domain-containing protein [Bacteroidota bacterium]
MLGNIILELTTENSVAVIDTRNLSQGVYLCRVVENDNVITRKFIVK